MTTKQAFERPRSEMEDVNRSSQAQAGPLLPANVGHSASVLLVVLGLEEDAVAELAKQTTESPEDANCRPIFVTDLDRFQIFTSQGLLFEHFPSRISQSMAPLDLAWSQYFRRRIDLLVAKWQPSAIVPFGGIARDIVTAWREERIGTN